MGFFKKYKAELIVASGALLAGVLSFFITLSVYPKIHSNAEKENNINNQYAQNMDTNNIIDLNNYEEGLNVDNTENDNDIFISLNEMEEADNIVDAINDFEQLDEIDTLPNVEQQEDNISNFDDEDIKVAQNMDESEVNIDVENQEIEEENIIEAISKSTLTPNILPISGDIILEFAKDKLVFSETLEEWITHDGIDIKGEVAEPVKAVADGVVESVKMDPRYGNTIIINHGNNYKTVYSNLSTLELVYAGKQVELGEIISGVGEGFGFESKEGPHVHFEVIIDGECKNPVNR